MSDLSKLKEKEVQDTKQDGNTEKTGRSLLSVVIKNVKGSLAQVTRYCADNNMNIERLTLSNFKLDNLEHRVILYITGDRNRINSLVEGIKKLEVVVSAINFQADNYIERELILVKVKEDDPNISRIMDIVSDYSGSTIFYRNSIIIFQFINEEEINNEIMNRLEHVSDKIEILKSGIVATSLDDKMDS